MKSRHARSVTAVAAGSLVIAALTACGSSSETTKGAAESASKATSAAKSVTSDAPSPSASESSSSSSSTGESSPGTSSSASSDSPAQLPAGTQEVKANIAKIAFAAPAGWVVVNADNAKDPAILSKLETIAKRQSTSPEKLTSAYTALGDVVVIDASAKQKFNDNVNVVKITRPTLLTEEQYRAELTRGSQLQATPGAFSKINTPAGPGVQMEFSVKVRGNEFHGVSMELPNGSGSYSTLTVSAMSAQTAVKVAKDIAATARKL